MSIATTISEVGGDTEPTLTDAPRRGSKIIRDILSSPGSALSAAYIVLVLCMAVFAPLIVKLSGWGPYAFDEAAIDPNMGGVPVGSFGGISSDHWFGVEPVNGRDIFARIVYGARASMVIALASTALTTLMGVIFGLVAGYFGGIADTIISRLMEFLMAFPALIFMIAILSALPADNRQYLLVLVISVFGWPYLARVVRGQTLSLKQREFVESARASGAASSQVIFREILPNLLPTIIVMTTLAIPGYIGTEAGLSFLGVGVVPPTPSWGQMIAASTNWYSVDPMFFIFPGLFLFMLVLSFMVLGERVRRVVEVGEISS
jgi:peptide/nickel transport system permease protein